MVTRSAVPPKKWSGKPPLPFCVVWGLVGGNPPPSLPPCGVGSGGWESPSLRFPRPVVWGLVGSTLRWEVLVGLKRCACRVGSPVVVKLSLVRQTIFSGRRFCSETLGCPFRCFGRPWRFLFGTIQYRVIESVLMTSRPPITYCTLCYILDTTYSRVCTIYCRLYSVHMVYLYTIARPLKGGNQVLQKCHVGARL